MFNYLSATSVVALFISMITPSVAQVDFGRRNIEVDGINLHYNKYFVFELSASQPDQDDTRLLFFQPQFRLKAGNAAPYYYRAFLKWYSQSFETRSQLFDNSNRWFQCEIDELPMSEVESFLAKQKELFLELEIAIHRRSCDWGLDFANMDFRDFVRHQMFEATLMRTFGRLNQLRTRAEISRQDFDAASKSITRGIKMARDISEMRLFIPAIVGERIADMTLRSVIELSQVPDSPNLRYALQSLPHPIIDFRVETEFEIVERNFQFLGSPELSNRTPEQWRLVFKSAIQQLDVYENEGALEATNSSSHQLETRAAILMARLYPIAKHELLKSGWKKSKVDAMPVAKVVAIQTSLIWNDFIASTSQLQNAPDQVSSTRRKQKRLRFEMMGYDRESSRGNFPFLERLMPTIPPLTSSRSFSRNGSISQKIAILQNVEMIRTFVALNKRLPKTLAELEPWNPIPDPNTGQPFVYELNSNSQAILRTNIKSIKRAPQNRFIELAFELNFENKILREGESK